MIEIEHLTKRYGKRIAVNDVSFSVKKGEIVGLLGANGAGKSTTMNMLTGYISSTSGSVRVEGQDILEHPDEVRRQLGYLPEVPPLYPDMTVREYLNFVYDLKKCRFDRRKHLEEICEVVRISDIRNRLIGKLSKGLRQRVGLAQALINNPPVIILDEPTAGLDPVEVVEVRNLIRMLGRDHAVILSSHVLSEVQAVCDRVIILKAGKVIADARTEEIAAQSQGKRRVTVRVAGPEKAVLAAIRSLNGVTFVQSLPEKEMDSVAFSVESEAGVDIRKPLFYAMSKNDWPIVGMQATGVNFEDVFLSLVKSSDAARPKRRVRVKSADDGKKEA